MQAPFLYHFWLHFGLHFGAIWGAKCATRLILAPLGLDFGTLLLHLIFVSFDFNGCGGPVVGVQRVIGIHELGGGPRACFDISP